MEQIIAIRQFKIFISFYLFVQVHCHHCGKEVEIIAAVDDTEQEILAQEEATANIVMPPADFADSPEGTRQPHRIYKKLDRRLRSEERHGERKHYRNRQESARAKVHMNSLTLLITLLKLFQCKHHKYESNELIK